MLRSLHINNVAFHATELADEILLLRAAHPLTSQIGNSIRSLQLDFISDVISTETEICLKVKRQLLPDDIIRLQRVVIKQDASKKLKLPIRIETTAADEIQKHTGLTIETYIDQLLNKTYTVAMLGFLPGFIYLNGLPEEMQVPRLATPHTRIPPKSLAIGGPYLGLYSLPSPGGWHVIGQFGPDVLDVHASNPSLLQAGDELILEIAPASQWEQIKSLTILEYNGLT